MLYTRENSVYNINYMSTEEKGYVYIFTNPSMQGYIKIGHAKDLKRRLKALDTTGIPTPFEPYFAVRTAKYKELERVIHRELDKLTDTRARKNREFFKIVPEIARDMMLNISSLLDDREIENFGNETAKDAKNTNGSVRPMSSPTTFAMLGIPVGAELIPITNKYPKVKTVDNENHVQLENGEVKAISRAVIDATGRSLNGFSCYRYHGEVLTNIRKRIDRNYLPSCRR